MSERPALYDLGGRVAVITGGAGLLGPEHAAALAVLGATAVITDIDLRAAEAAASRVQRQHGVDRVEWLRMDVTDPETIAAACGTVVARHGGVHILINNAAVDPKVEADESGVERSRLEHFSLHRWNLELAVGLTGAFLCSQIFGSWMAEHGGGVILNIASDLSVFGPDQRLYKKEGVPEDDQPVKPITYSVIKTGLIGLTRYLATYWADKNVRINALSPGGIHAGQPEEFVRRLTNLIPVGRMADVNEYWGAVQFLCSDASRYMTGQNLVVDGGRSVW